MLKPDKGVAVVLALHGACPEGSWTAGSRQQSQLAELLIQQVLW